MKTSRPKAPARRPERVRPGYRQSRLTSRDKLRHNSFNMGSMAGITSLGGAGASPARRFGFQRGDIIVSVNGIEVGSIEALREAIQSSRERWEISIRRDGRVLSSVITG